ncbi:MAG: hypothetical protein M8467_20835 [Anaerolineae bacterium]|nr:hypothetical protein [Anaerolineae bacterium]
MGGEALIAVSPASLAVPVRVGTVVTQTLSICYLGVCPLVWQVDEQVPVSHSTRLLAAALPTR